MRPMGWALLAPRPKYLPGLLLQRLCRRAGRVCHDAALCLLLHARAADARAAQA